VVVIADLEVGGDLETDPPRCRLGDQRRCPGTQQAVRAGHQATHRACGDARGDGVEEFLPALAARLGLRRSTFARREFGARLADPVQEVVFFVEDHRPSAEHGRRLALVSTESLTFEQDVLAPPVQHRRVPRQGTPVPVQLPAAVDVRHHDVLVRRDEQEATVVVQEAVGGLAGDGDLLRPVRDVHP